MLATAYHQESMYVQYASMIRSHLHCFLAAAVPKTPRHFWVMTCFWVPSVVPSQALGRQLAGRPFLHNVQNLAADRLARVLRKTVRRSCATSTGASSVVCTSEV